MRLRLVILLAATAALAACTQTSKPTPQTDDDKTFYALGALFARTIGSVETFDLSDKEWEMVKAGIMDGSRQSLSLKDEEVEALIPKLQELQRTRMEAKTTREKEAGTAFLAKAASEEGAQKTTSGMVYKTVEEGTGASPVATDVVKVHYTGKFVDGKVFDSSFDHDPPDPAEFPLDGVIPCWTEGVQLMKAGGKAQLVCPPDLAYGDQGGPGMRGGATLVFDVELLEVEKPADDAAAAAK